ncbi:MAG: hypothetical protein ACJ8R9_23345 [Steroidobacteraceae bacterium]
MSDSNMSVGNSNVTNGTLNRNDSPSGSSDSANRSGSQVPDPAQVRQQAQLFRTLMDAPITVRQLAELAGRNAGVEVAGRGAGANPDEFAQDSWMLDRWSPADSRGGLQDLANHSHQGAVDVSAMMQVQHLIEQGPAGQAAAAAGAPDPSIAELIEKHVRRALSSIQARSSTDGEVRIELSDAVFPGAALSLKRTADGWHLNATADNRQSLDKLNHFAPALVERFARASLGHLQVSLEVHPADSPC